MRYSPICTTSYEHLAAITHTGRIFIVCNLVQDIYTVELNNCSRFLLRWTNQKENEPSWTKRTNQSSRCWPLLFWSRAGRTVTSDSPLPAAGHHPQTPGLGCREVILFRVLCGLMHNLCAPTWQAAAKPVIWASFCPQRFVRRQQCEQGIQWGDPRRRLLICASCEACHVLLLPLYNTIRLQYGRLEPDKSRRRDVSMAW